MAKKNTSASTAVDASTENITIPEVNTRAKHAAFAEGKLKYIDPQGDDEIKDRYDIVVIVDATDTNPNGDPDCGNAPRFEPLANRIYMTPESVKAKIREGITTYLPDAEILHDQYAVCKADRIARVNPKLYELSCSTKDKKSPLPLRDLLIARARLNDVLCDAYTDVRWFGETLCDGSGSVHGPVEILGSKILSVVPSVLTDITITSRLVNHTGGAEHTMGSHVTNSYDVFPIQITVNVPHARRTGMTMNDLNNLISILPRVFDLTNSSTRHLVFREMYVFKTPNTMRGSSTLTTEAFYNSFKVKEGVENPRKYEDVEYTVPNVPGIEVIHYDACGNIVK